MQVDIKSLNSPKAQATPKSRKPIAMNEPPKMQKFNSVISENVEPPKGYFYGVLPDELKDNVKNIAIRGLSLPAKQRAPLLQAKLLKSDYINRYLNRYLVVDQLAIMNDHVKFALVYGFNFLDTMTMDITPFLQKPPQQQQPQQQQPQQTRPDDAKLLDSIKPSE